MNIVVLTLQFGDLPYFTLTSEINRGYCRRHGYSWKVANRLFGINRNPIWSKVKRTSEVLGQKEVDFVLFIDADAWFHDESKRIEQLIDTHWEPETLMLVGTDRRDKAFGWNDTTANTGVFLVKNNPTSRHIFEEWWHTCLYDPSTAFGWPIEQLAFNKHIHPRWQSANTIKLVPYHHLSGLDGTYIRHAVGLKGTEKMKAIQMAYNRAMAL